MDKNLLIYEMKKKGLNVAELCEKIGISKSAFYRKCNGQTEFKLDEIKKIKSVLGLDTVTPIFFTSEVS